MTIPAFRPDPKRDAAAAELAQTAGSWPRVTLRRDVGAFRRGEHFFGVPSSQPGRYYLTNPRFCSCPDYQQRASGCKHQRAVALHLAAEEAAGGAEDFEATIDGVNAIRAAFGSDVDAVVTNVRPTRCEDLLPAED